MEQISNEWSFRKKEKRATYMFSGSLIELGGRGGGIILINRRGRGEESPNLFEAKKLSGTSN